MENHQFGKKKNLLGVCFCKICVLPAREFCMSNNLCFKFTVYSMCLIVSSAFLQFVWVSVVVCAFLNVWVSEHHVFSVHYRWVHEVCFMLVCSHDFHPLLWLLRVTIGSSGTLRRGMTDRYFLSHFSLFLCSPLFLLFLLILLSLSF